MVETTIGGQGAKWDGHVWLGKMVGDFGNVLTMSWVTSNSSNSCQESLVKEIRLWASTMLEVEEDTLGLHL
jgi:hypothetical protein